jgi:hypothetical protein
MAAMRATSTVESQPVEVRETAPPEPVAVPVPVPERGPMQSIPTWPFHAH